MAPNRIFLVELLVEDLQMFSQPEIDTKTPPKPELVSDEEPPTCLERCIRLQLANLARCEVCEKDFGSQFDMEQSKMGENCMFTLNQEELQKEDLSFDISALEKQTDGRKEVLGKWKEPANETLKKLMQSYEDANAKKSSSKTSVQSDGSIAKKSIPVSETIKSMYPLHSEEEVVTGCVILTLRISCLGSRITQKVMFGGKGSQQAISCFKSVDQEEEEQFMKCVTFDEANHPHPVICKSCEEPKTSKATLPPTPPGSVCSVKEVCKPYDEYTAQMNGNAISIRVERDSEIKVMLDKEGDGGCTKGCWTSLTLPEGVYALEERYVQRQENACRLPVIRGNLKYPAEQWSSDFMMCKQKRPVCAEDFRKRTEDPTRSVCMQTRDPEQPVTSTPCGIEICKKGWHDPNVDVFVLKLGKNKTSRAEDAPNQIELELRTPKGPMVEKRPKETRGVQVIEEEFEDIKKPAAAPTTTKKPKKEKKAAAKKGKKK